jgi:hypothetical protein
VTENVGGQTFLSVGEDAASRADANAARVLDRQECPSSYVLASPVAAGGQPRNWRFALVSGREQVGPMGPNETTLMIRVRIGLPLWLLLAACAIPALAQQPSLIEQGYIRPGARLPAMPPLRGDRYADTVPDTLDLAEMAELAINGLTGPSDPQAGYELYFMVYLQRNPPVMQHDFGDGNQCKFMGPLALMRVITGSDSHRREERGMLEAYLKSIGDDGLYYPPLRGRPWFRENMWAEVRGKERDPKTLPPHEGGRMNPRLLEALMLYHLRDREPLWKTIADKMVDNGVGGGLKRYVESTNDWGVAPGTPDSAVPKGFLACDAWTPQALAQYYRLTGRDLVKQAAGKMVRHQKDHIGYFAADGRFILTAPGMAPTHFHVHSLSVLGFLDYALAVGDRELIAYCRKSYEWARTQGSPLIGFFPENLQPDFANSEGCAIADMLAWALMLSSSGNGDYWDDADRWLRNCFAEFQLTPQKAKQLARAVQSLPRQPVRYHETADRVLQRSVGAFAGWPGVNEWVRRIGIQHCCTGNCARTIYYVWENILDFQEADRRLGVNLLLNRASPWADVYSFLPYEGRVELRIKRPCKSVLVRMPEWIPAVDGAVACRVEGQAREVRWAGRYVDSGAAAPGARIALRFPIAERTVRQHVGGGDYTFTFKGNTVVAIDPPGKVCPLFDRAHYRQNEAPMRDVKRFVASEPIRW